MRCLSGRGVPGGHMEVVLGPGKAFELETEKGGAAADRVPTAPAGARAAAPPL
jgi:hypothetical protein